MALNSMTSKDVAEVLAKYQVQFFLLEGPTRYYVLRHFQIIASYVNSVKSVAEMVELLRNKHERPVTKNKDGRYIFDYFKIIAATRTEINVVYGKKCTWRELRVITELRQQSFCKQ